MCGEIQSIDGRATGHGLHLHCHPDAFCIGPSALQLNECFTATCRRMWTVSASFWSRTPGHSPHPQGNQTIALQENWLRLSTSVTLQHSVPLAIISREPAPGVLPMIRPPCSLPFRAIFCLQATLELFMLGSEGELVRGLSMVWGASWDEGRSSGLLL